MIENLRGHLATATLNDVTHLVLDIQPQDLNQLTAQVIRNMIENTPVLGLNLEPRRCNAACAVVGEYLRVDSLVSIQLPVGGEYAIRTRVQVVADPQSAIGVRAEKAEITARQRPNFIQKMALAPVSLDAALQQACGKFPESLTQVARTQLNTAGYDLNSIFLSIEPTTVRVTIDGSPHQPRSTS